MPSRCARLCFFQERTFNVNQIRRVLLALPLVPASTLALAQPTAEPIRLALIEGLSGPFANAGEAVFRNLLLATERINCRGGVRVAGVARPLALVRMDSKGNAEDALGLLRGALDQRIGFVLQGNSSATAAALVDALEKHNEREPQRRALFLNYSALDPALTNERCSFWHFRFDAHADMRLAALTDVLRDDRAVQRVYLIAQDYSFGQHVMKQSRLMIAARRPAAFRQRFPERQDHCVHACMHLMLEMLATTLVPRIQSHLQGCRDRLVALVFCVAGPGAA